MKDIRKPPTRAELQSLADAVFGSRVACAACGVVGPQVEGHGGPFCSDCHHGCRCERCPYPIVDGIPPSRAERFLRWLACHAQAGEAEFAGRFAEANARYIGEAT